MLPGDCTGKKKEDAGTACEGAREVPFSFVCVNNWARSRGILCRLRLPSLSFLLPGDGRSALFILLTRSC